MSVESPGRKRREAGCARDPSSRLAPRDLARPLTVVRSSCATPHSGVEGPRVLIYTGDVLGLGHVRRNTTIAKRLVAELPDTNVLLLTSVPTANFFEPLRGIEFIKLPSVRKLPSGGFCSQALEIDGAGFWKLRTGVIESVARHYRPDLVLVDHLPAGVAGDLLPAVRALRNASRPPRIVLGLRDVLDDPAEIETRWHDAGIYRAI
ncbi:MAG: hypothetical protein OEQ13_15015, partial [Acidobacteriota bacterium]|nr:hypothetical protein [Acidobacteriota bacterium]